MDDRIEELHQVLREDPTSRQFYQLGELLRRAGRLDEAAEVLRRGLEHHARYVAAWVSLARTLASAGDHEGAEWAAAKALEIDPQNAVAARIIAESAEQRGDHRRAASAWRLASALTPGDAELEERARRAEERLTAAEGAPAPEVTPPEPVVPPPLPAEPVVAAEGDPFAVEPTGETDVFFVGDDVFAVGPTEPEAGAPFGEEPASAAEAIAGPAAPPEPVASEGGEEELPLPTVTLARLALQQGDLELARSTLERVRRMRGETPEVQELAREIAARQRGGTSLEERKIERLKGWLDRIRLAAERS